MPHKLENYTTKLIKNSTLTKRKLKDQIFHRFLGQSSLSRHNTTCITNIFTDSQKKKQRNRNPGKKEPIFDSITEAEEGNLQKSKGGRREEAMPSLATKKEEKKASILILREAAWSKEKEKAKGKEKSRQCID